MSAGTDSPAEVGFSSRLNWLLGGAVGGAVGAAIFGGLLWLIDPAIVTETIPAIYGLDLAGSVGWLFHLLHGAALGIVFGLLVTREPILGTLSADVETGFIAAMGPSVRLSLAGMVYGLAVWVFLPGVLFSFWVAIGVLTDPGFPTVAVESLVGHLLFGLVLGALFSMFVEVAPEAAETDAPFDEAS